MLYILRKSDLVKQSTRGFVARAGARLRRLSFKAK